MSRINEVIKNPTNNANTKHFKIQNDEELSKNLGESDVLLQNESKKEKDDEKGILSASNEATTNFTPTIAKPLTNKFGITNLEFMIMLPITIIQIGYYFGQVAYQTLQIQKVTPLKRVVESWFGYYRDDSDFQWREFRENILLFIFGMLIFVLISRAIKNHYHNQPQNKFKALIIFYLTTGVIYLIYLFEAGFLMWMFFTLSNYGLQKILYKNKYYPILLWAYSIWSLYYIYYYNYQPFDIIAQLFPTFGESVRQSKNNAMVPWNMVYNMTLLRVMSFCLDKHWAFHNLYKFDATKHLGQCQLCQQEKTCYKARSEQYLDSEYYDNIFYFYAYLTYLPLFITGPQISFNAFISQLLVGQKVHSRSQAIIYFARALNNILILELFTHLSFASALSKVPENQPYWLHFTFSECMFMGFLNLLFIWLKFLTIWRLARAFTILDGIDCVENMNRCVLNNYCFEGFWRSWHRGFNQWLIRYLFIPLGGSKTKFWNIWIVFSFVAIWHDFTLDLVVWAWFICASLIPEMFVKTWCNKKDFLWKTRWFKYVCAFAACVYVWLMAMANLIGFGNGWVNMQIIFGKLNEHGASLQIFIIMSCMYFLPMVSFYIRDREQDKGF